MNILIASKKYPVADDMREILSYHVDTRLVDTEWELRRELENRNYDIVLFDYDLPQVSGVRFVEELAKDNLLPSIFYVCGLEAISSYESRLRNLEGSRNRVLPVETIFVAYTELFRTFLLKSA
jgi:DNA-binding response OmpR family regulator